MTLPQPLSQPSADYYLEYLPNVSKVLLVSKLDLACADSYQLVLDAGSRQLLVEAVPHGPTALPVKRLPGKPSWTRISLDFLPPGTTAPTPVMTISHDTLTIQFAGSIPQHHLNAPPPALNAARLGACTGLCCAACGASLGLHTPSTLTWKDLPNDHWLELLDCWSCHDNEFAAIAEQALAHGHAEPATGRSCAEPAIGRSCAEPATGRCCATPHPTQSHAHTQSPAHTNTNTNTQTHSHAHTQSHAHSNSNPNTSSYHQLNNAGSSMILPPPGRIYVGLSYFLLHKRDLGSVRCPACTTPIGQDLATEHVQVLRDLVTCTFATGTEAETTASIVMRRIRDTIDNACVFAYVLKSPSHGQMYVKLLNWSLSLRLGTQDTLSPWRSAFKLAFRTSADTLHHLPHEYETLHLTDLQFDRIAGLLHSIHTDLFAGGAEASSDPEALKQSYLLVK